MHVEGPKMLQIRRHLVYFGHSNGLQIFYVWRGALAKVMDNPGISLNVYSSIEDHNTHLLATSQSVSVKEPKGTFSVTKESNSDKYIVI